MVRGPARPADDSRQRGGSSELVKRPTSWTSASTSPLEGPFLAEFDLAKVMKRGTRAKAYGPGCRLILEHLSERCAANCLTGKTSNASRCSAYNDPSFDCGSRRCADACLRRDDATGRIECLNEMHVKNNSAAKCLLPREGVATRWCGVATPAPSPRPPSRPKKPCIDVAVAFCRVTFLASLSP